MDANDDNRQPIMANMAVIRDFYLLGGSFAARWRGFLNCDCEYPIHSIFIPTFPKCFFAH
jgi:hypothetical protein